jgi:hypothetical protein
MENESSSTKTIIKYFNGSFRVKSDDKIVSGNMAKLFNN